MTRRIHYIDWLRVGAVLLLFPFHTWRVFNANEAFYVKSPYLSQAINWVIGFIDVWHMPLLFLLAGASTYFALKRRTGWQYLGERVTRLLVPLLFGWLVLITPQTWIGARFNSGYTASIWTYLTSGDFLKWNIQDGGDYFGGFGLGHLWFILYLLVIALLALPLLLWWRSERGSRFVARLARLLAHPAGWLLAALLLWIAEGLPSPDEDKSLFFFFGLFVFGYAIMNDEKFLAAAERYRWPVIVTGVGLTLFNILTGSLRGSLPDPSWPLMGLNVAGMLAIWLMIMGLLGLGRRYFDKPSSALSYLAEASYPLYILHQTVIVLLAFWIVRLPGPWPVQWGALLTATLVVTFGMYEIVRRVPILRFCFGMRPKPSAETREVVPAQSPA